MRRQTILFYRKHKAYIPYLGLAFLMWPSLFTVLFNLRPLPEFWRYVFISVGIVLLLPHFLINSFIPNLKHHKITAILQLLVILVSLFILLAPEKFFFLRSWF